MRVFALVCLASLAAAAVPGDLITNLPGWSPNPWPSPQYSGYITVDPVHGRYLHYWLVLSENNPATDPVVMWMNGGPGCSSLDGFFYEHGPLHFADDVTSEDGVPQLVLNPYRWSQIANVLYVEAPAGVGFSYSNTPSDYNTDDQKTAVDNFHFLENFFSLYPEYANNDFYVTGESYAGVYVPTLVQQIMINNDAGRSKINLKGFAVGNGCTGNDVGACSNYGTQIRADFLAGHGLYSTDLQQQVQAACNGNWLNPNAQCQAALNEMSNQVGDVNMYDLYTDCISGSSKQKKTSKMQFQNVNRRIPSPRNPVHASLLAKMVRGPDECIDGIEAEALLNNDAVRAAIHVLPLNATQIPPWTLCTGNINYNGTVSSLIPLYPTLIARYRTLIYNGDVDACVPYTDNEAWVESLGLQVAQPWRPWSVNNQVAGYVTSYALNNFHFLTVKGSGHMVPQYRPLQAFAMIQRFLNNQPF